MNRSLAINIGLVAAIAGAMLLSLIAQQARQRLLLRFARPSRLVVSKNLMPCSMPCTTAVLWRWRVPLRNGKPYWRGKP